MLPYNHGPAAVVRVKINKPALYKPAGPTERFLRKVEPTCQAHAGVLSSFWLVRLPSSAPDIIPLKYPTLGWFPEGGMADSSTPHLADEAQDPGSICKEHLLSFIVWLPLASDAIARVLKPSKSMLVA